MKTYVATFYNNNYGSALQAFALQSKLKELGCDPAIIVPEPKITGDSLLEKTKFYFRKEKHYGPVRKIRRSIQKRVYSGRRKKINAFIKNNAAMIPYKDALPAMRSDSCVLLAGSDQIWNTINHPIEALYLFSQIENKNARKVSYAASIGRSDITEEQKNYYRQALADFETISFREDKALKLLRDEFPDKEVRQDVDPTLLFNGGFWESLLPPHKEIKPYLFVYMLRPDKNVIRIARKLAGENGLKIIYIGLYSNRYPGIKTVTDAGVEEFLSYIHDADMVVTNSFHGTVFSLLFHKKFVSVHVDSTSSRVENLLRLVSLEDHKIGSVADCSVANEGYDCESIDMKLEEERNKSIEYLKRVTKA